MPESKGYIISSDEKGSISISEDVVAVIAASAAMDVEGVYEPFFSHGKDFGNMLGKKVLPKGIKLNIDGDGVTIEVSIITEMGYSVSEVGAQVQRAVISAVEDAVGVSVNAVNVFICGIALRKKEK